VQIIARLTYRQRYAQSTGRDPLIVRDHRVATRGRRRSWRLASLTP
jgi:hypothetical protein